MTPPNSYVEAQILNEVMLGGRTFRSLLGFDEVMAVDDLKILITLQRPFFHTQSHLQVLGVRTQDMCFLGSPFSPV